jgi:hypothetical protein
MANKLKKGADDELTWDDIEYQLKKRKQVFAQLIPFSTDRMFFNHFSRLINNNLKTNLQKANCCT